MAGSGEAAEHDESPRSGRTQRGVVLPSGVVMLSVVAVLMAALAYVVTRDNPPDEKPVAETAGQDASPSAEPSEQPKPDQQPEPKPKPKPIERAEVFVEVYNNSGITGLAGSVGEQAADAGWQVVGTDNWVGTIPANTVYFPPRLARAGKQLALDLGIDRTNPAVGSMKLDRLTVILTGDV